MEYNRLSDYLKTAFGGKVYRLSLQTGCTCPNRDGTISFGGCTFCSEGGSGDFAAECTAVSKQIEEAKKKVDRKFSGKIAPEDRKYIAYFQSFTNTYGEEDRLLSMFREAMEAEGIAAVSIGTRPDCLSEKMVNGLAELNREKPVWVELGLQTIHEKTAERINRGYTLDIFDQAYGRLKEAGLAVIVHVILGLPGESREDMLETIRYLAQEAPVLDGIKIQLLHILKGTALGKEYEKKPFPVLNLEEYAALVVDCLRLLPPETVVHRITGDGPKKLLIAPLWSGDKKRVLNTLNKAIREA